MKHYSITYNKTIFPTNTKNTATSAKVHRKRIHNFNLHVKID